MNVEEMFKSIVEIKELSSFKRPLFVGPHPDDIEFGCGALISKLKEKGADIHFLIVTDGAAGTDDPALPPYKLKEMRENEAKNAAKFLGASTIDFIALEDGGIYTSEDVTRLASPFILKYQPDIIFTTDPNLRSECHNDHIKTGEGIRGCMQIIGYPEALRRHLVNIDNVKSFPRNITLAYYFSDEPNAFVEISAKNLKDQQQSLMLHESQMKDDSMKMLVGYFGYKAQMDGKKNNVPLAEVFQVIVPVCQHVYSEGLKY